MKILSENQLPSGDYQLDCEFTEEEIQMFIQYAFVNILRDTIKKEKKKEKKK